MPNHPPSFPKATPPTPKDFLTSLREPGPGRLQVAASLLDRGADINGVYEFPRKLKSGPLVSRERVTGLYDAAKRGDLEVVQFLLSRGVDVRARNQTGMSPHPLDNYRTIDTLCGLDAMRTSEESKIVELAEERFGVEIEEEFIRRRDVFDELSGYYVRRKGVPVKPKIKRVKSVLKKSGSKKRGVVEGDPSVDSETNGQKRYSLRARTSGLSYAP